MLILLGPLGAGVVHANGYYPSYCVRDGYAPYKYPGSRENAHWEQFCYLGTDGSRFIKSANYVVGVQRELSVLGIGVGAIDGIFGSQTKAGVQFFQMVTNLAPDGIVGYLTWFNLMAYCPYHYSSSGYDVHHPKHGTYVGPDCFRHKQSDHLWETWNKAGTYFVRFYQYGPQ